MKVLHLISGGDSGGAKTHLFSLLDKLKELVTVRVGCLIDGVFYEELIKKDIDSVLFLQKSRFDLSVIDSIAKMINEEKFDVLHVHGARANFVARFVMKKTDVPVVTTMHSDYMLDFDAFVKKIVFTNLNRLSLKGIPYFIAVSDNFKDMLIERGFNPNAIHVVYNGMDYSKVPDYFTPKEEYARSHGFVYDENKIYVGIAARFDVVKGVDIFIKAAGEAAKKRDDLVFLIAGDGAEKDRLLSLAEETGCGDRIKFLGYEHDIYGFLNIIDINCLTSLCESFPYSMLEGAAMGKPMAASRVGGIPALVIEGETGCLFESGNYEELAGKLLMMADNKELRKEMGQNIKIRATTLFSSDKFAKDHVKIYESICDDYRDKKHCDFLISGYYGFGNNGDDALLLAITEDIKRKKENARITVLSKTPEETKRIYKVNAISRINPFVIGRAMKNSKVLISGGGSLLQDATSSKSLWYYLYIIKKAKRSGLKVMQMANGFGPVKRKKNIELTRRVLNRSVDCITLRDEESVKKMDEIGITVKKTVTADPALLLKGSDKKRVDEILRGENIPERKYVTVSVREWKDSADDFERTAAESLLKMCREKGVCAVFIPMQFPNDCGISERIAKRMGEDAFVIKRKLDIKDTIGVIRGAEINIAMRLHAMIYSASEGVRTAALRYDPKIDGFMEYVGIGNVEDVRTIDTKKLDALIEKTFDSDISGVNRELFEKAEINTLMAIELLESERQ